VNLNTKRNEMMNYVKSAVKKGIVVGIVVATTSTAGAQIYYDTPGTFQGNIIQQGEIFQQPTEEELKQPSIGALLYDTGGSPAVRSVFANGPAQKAGVQSGDLITKINGEATTNVTDFNSKIASMTAGDSVKLTHSRDGKEADITVSVMTFSDVSKASLVAEAGVFDSAIGQSELRIESTKQRIKNTQMDLEDLTKSLAEQEKELEALKAKAEVADKEAEEKKAAEAAKRAADAAEKEAASEKE